MRRHSDLIWLGNRLEKGWMPLNAPNPANPNAQDQFVDAVQGPTNQAQDPAVQNQAQGPAVQNQAQGPAVQHQVQDPVNNNALVGQNIPMQLPQQPVPT